MENLLYALKKPNSFAELFSINISCQLILYGLIFGRQEISILQMKYFNNDTNKKLNKVFSGKNP